MRPGRKNGIKPDGWKIELELGNKQDLLEIGREKKVQDGKDSRAIQLGVLSINDKTLEPPHNTQKIIAESLAISRICWRLARQKERPIYSSENIKKSPTCHLITNRSSHTIRVQLSPRALA